MGQDFGAPPRQNAGMPGWAWLIILPCGCLVLAVPLLVIFAAISAPVFTQARGKARQVSCLSNIKQQGLGLMMYLQDYDERFPPSQGWMDKLDPYIKNDQVFRCPAAADRSSKDTYGYAYNSTLSRKELKKVGKPETVVMIYDSSDLSRNAADAKTSLPSPPRHLKANNVGYADGHARAVQTDPSGP